METRLALALALSLGILVGFQVLFPQPKTDPKVAGEAATSAVAPAVEDHGQPGVAPASPDVQAEPGPIVTVAGPLFRARIASNGGRIVSFELLDYQKDPAPGDGPYDLVRQAGAGPLALLWRNESGAVVDDRSVAYEVTASAEAPRAGEPAIVTMKGRTSTGASITKVLELPYDSYVADLKVTTEGLAATPLAVGWSRE